MSNTRWRVVFLFVASFVAWGATGCRNARTTTHDGGADADADADVTTTTIEGRVWSYYYMDLVMPPIGLNWAAGAHVEASWAGGGTTATAGMSGEFALADVPVGAEMLIMSHATNHHDAVSRLMTVAAGDVEWMVLPTTDLITRITAPAMWNITLDATKGFVAGLLCTWNGTADPPVTGYIGNATVTITPTVTGADYELIYFDSTNPSNKTRTSTDPAQSIFFAVNLPVRDATSPYELTVTASGHTFQPVEFPVIANTMTYLLIKAD